MSSADFLYRPEKSDSFSHVHTAWCRAPVRFLPFETLVSHEFYLFYCGKKQFFTPNLPDCFHDAIFYPHLNRFAAELRLREIKTIAMHNETVSEWKIKYECYCPRPRSLFCQALRANLYRVWIHTLTESIPQDASFMVDLEELRSTFLNHCSICRGYSVLFIIMHSLNPEDEDPDELTINPFRVTSSEIVLRVPIRKQRYFPYSCLMDIMETMIPYKCRIVFF